ncbi:MAG: hypothetical protein HY815_21975 [Candidatus Riflebacteria bacterium]|nr:hypothetical protein [Candidatus Riflebacteria bacterium]
MKILWTMLIVLGLAGLAASPALARHRGPVGTYYTDGTYVDGYGRVYHDHRYCNGGYYHSYSRYHHKVREHKRRRNVLLGVGALGLITRSRTLGILGLGGAVANEIIDRRHRDY